MAKWIYKLRMATGSYDVKQFYQLQKSDWNGFEQAVDEKEAELSSKIQYS